MKVRRLVRVAVGVGLVIGPAAFVSLWLLFQHKPGWYQPVIVNETVLQRARTESAAMVDEVSRQIVEANPFEVTLSESAVNEWLAALPHLSPDTRRSIPSALSDLAVRFDAGKVKLGGLYDHKGWRAILSVGLVVGLSESGTEVTITLTEVHGGSLPVPRAILEDILQAIPHQGGVARAEPHSLGAGRDVERAQAQTIASGSFALHDVRSVDELLQGTRIRNRFIWPNGDRPFRIDSIAVGNGELRLGIEPL